MSFIASSQDDPVKTTVVSPEEQIRQVARSLLHASGGPADPPRPMPRPLVRGLVRLLERHLAGELPAIEAVEAEDAPAAVLHRSN